MENNIHGEFAKALILKVCSLGHTVGIAWVLQSHAVCLFWALPLEDVLRRSLRTAPACLLPKYGEGCTPLSLNTIPT